MSYPGYPNYNSCYGAPQDEQTPQNGYAPYRSNVPTPSYPDPVAYSTETRQTEYKSPEYSRPTPNQQSYNTNHTGQGQYAGDPDRDATSCQTFDYQQRHAPHIGSNEQQAETQAYSQSVSHAPKQPSTHALNELAYASRLEPSGIQNEASSRSVQPLQRNHTSQNSADIPTRPESSAMHIQQSYGPIQSSSYGSQNTYRTPDQNQPALQAAAALQGLPKHSRANPASPAVSNRPLTQATPQQSSQSPYVTSTSQLQSPPTLAPAATPAMTVMAQPCPIVFDPNVAPDSVPTMQPLPARGKNLTTAWPESSHEVIATEAIKFLKSNPQHESLSISEVDFVDMLRGKPSYIALCHLIEARGFRFDRTLFARCLMANIPSLSASQGDYQLPPSPKLAPVRTRGHPQSAVSAAFIPPAANHAPPFMNGPYIKPETQFQRFSAAIPLMNQRNTPLAAHDRSRLSVPAPQLPAPTSGSKENMARKRRFDDLIDLTKEDDEGYVVPQKIARLKSASPDPIIAFVKQSQPLHQSQSSVVRFGIPPPQNMLPKAVAPIRFDAQAPGPLPEGSTPPRSSKVMLARKLNKAEALRRNYYDPKTVARDILISTGQHPTERPLNGHLAGLLGTHIEIESDLSTLHWEDADPGGPPAPKTAWTDIPAGPPRFKSQNATSTKYHTLTTTDSDPKHQSLQRLVSEALDLTHGLAGNGPIAASKYPATFGSGNFMMVQECKGTPSPKRGRPPRHLPSSTSEPSDNSPRAARRAEDSLHTLTQQRKVLVNESLKPQTRQISGLRQPQAAANEVKTQSSQATPPNKRGRPRRESNLLASSPLLPTEPPLRRGPVRPPRSTVSPHVRISPPRPLGSVHPSQRSVSIEVPKMEDSLWPNNKRKGRLPGTKNKIPSSDNDSGAMAVQVIIPRLRPEDEPSEYPVFRCRWVKCGAELHNISTLRRHIAKLHKPAEDTVDAVGYGCYWKRCSLLRRDDEGNIEPTPIPTEEEWLDHINEEHIHPLGQRFGDGPSTAHIGKQNLPFEAIVSKYFYNPSLFPTDARIVSYTDPQAVASDRAIYLADESGRATTHLTHYNDEPDAVVLADFHTKETESNKAAENAFKSFLKNHGHTKLDMRAAADETFKAMAVRKERIGVGIDRGGCTLVNEERRKTFIQNPGISRVVEYDY